VNGLRIVSRPSMTCPSCRSLCHRTVVAAPVIAAALVGGAVVMAIKQWIDHVEMPSSRLRNAAVVVAALLFTWSLNEWNLLGCCRGQLIERSMRLRVR
jgi:hypothetical protein